MGKKQKKQQWIKIPYTTAFIMLIHQVPIQGTYVAHGSGCGFYMHLICRMGVVCKMGVVLFFSNTGAPGNRKLSHELKQKRNNNNKSIIVRESTSLNTFNR